MTSNFIQNLDFRLRFFGTTGIKWTKKKLYFAISSLKEGLFFRHENNRVRYLKLRGANNMYQRSQFSFLRSTKKIALHFRYIDHIYIQFSLLNSSDIKIVPQYCSYGTPDMPVTFFMTVVFDVSRLSQSLTHHDREGGWGITNYGFWPPRSERSGY